MGPLARTSRWAAIARLDRRRDGIEAPFDLPRTTLLARWPCPVAPRGTPGVPDSFFHSFPTHVGVEHGFHGDAYRDALVHRKAATRLLGLTPKAPIDVAVLRVGAGDIVVLCSSAVWNTENGERVVERLLGTPGSALEVCRRAAPHGDAAAVRFEVAEEA